MAPHQIAILIYGLSGGGVPRRTITLANALARLGHEVELLVVDASGDLRSKVDAAVTVIEIGGWTTRLPWIRTKRRRQFARVVAPLARYLRRRKPTVLLSADNQANLAAIRGRAAAGLDCPVIVSQRNNTSAYAADKPQLMSDILADYPKADVIVAVSDGVAEDLRALGLPAAKIVTIYNPVVDAGLAVAAAAPISHPWFGVAGRPLIIAAGRIGAQKDFDTLVRAFAALKGRGSPARLVILGDGKTPAARRNLAALAASLGVADDLDLPGFVPDAVPYIARADLFVLSSAWEGLGNVLIEAIACATPVVSTDCPSGPSEILAHGAVGRLTPVGDAEALARAMEDELAAPHDAATLTAQAQQFTSEESVRRYLELIDALAKPRR
jgi:glycosyltransferase involved in cell wall biosynthesis